MLVRSLTVLAGMFAGWALGAGFDCGKAKSTAESLVCQHRDISLLDERLSRVYAERLSIASDPAGEVKAQAKWLSHVRDRCASPSCLQAAYEARLFALKSGAFASTRCPIGEAGPIGAWQRRSGEGSFEEMAFSIDGSRREFSSWLHHRPEIAGGTWSFTDCVIGIQHPASKEMQFALTVTGYGNRQLRVREAGVSGVSVYRKIGR
jgi:uncharacterized protein YecT (DUF1311 family)